MSGLEGTQLSLEAAMRAREAGERAATHNTDVAWRLACDRAIESLAESGQPFSADECRTIVGEPVSLSPNALGARFLAASKAGTIVKLGYRTSTRPERRGGTVAVWRGAS